MYAIPVILWLIVLLVYALPSLARHLSDVWRSDKGFRAGAFVILALAAALYAYPTSAEKGGGTNEPPVGPIAPPPGMIWLYDAGGAAHLVPLGARILEEAP